MTGLLIASVDYFPNLGGISMMTHHLANGFSDSGVETALVAPSDENPLHMPRNYKVFRDTDAAPRVREALDWKTRELPRLSNMFRNLHASLNFKRLLLLHPFYYGPAAVAVSRELNIPVSVVFHGFELRSQLGFAAYLKGIRTKLSGKGPSLRSNAMYVARNSDEVLTNSHYTANIVKRTSTSAPIHVIGCGLSMEDFHDQLAEHPTYDVQAKRKLRTKLGLFPDKTLLGTMCRLVPSKNVSMLLDAVATSPHLAGLIIGNGSERSKLMTLARQLRVDDRVIWVERADEQYKWQLLAAMDCFCLLSKEMPNGQVEGFGIVLLEAAAAGTPVIATKSGGMIDVVKDEKTGLLVPIGDIDTLVSGINRYMNDTEFAADIVSNAREQIKMRFNWRTISGNLASRWKFG